MRWWLAVCSALLLAAACSGRPDGAADEAPAGALVVASFDFPESRLLAEVYAQALEAAGVDVQRQHALGQRELVLPALRQGLVDVVPEYAGSALDATVPGVDVDRADLEVVVEILRAAVEPWGVAVLEPAAASNQNVVAVLARRADADGLATLSDLAARSEPLVVGGPPECPQRPRCLPGLRDVYDLQVERFVPLAGEELVRRALADGVVDAGVLFSTDPVLAGEELTVLEDDRALQPPDHVVPVVSEAALDDPRVRPALDAVSARLTTRGLRFLNWRVAEGRGPADEAHGWLVRHGLADR